MCVSDCFTKSCRERQAKHPHAFLSWAMQAQPLLKKEKTVVEQRQHLVFTNYFSQHFYFYSSLSLAPDNSIS